MALLILRSPAALKAALRRVYVPFGTFFVFQATTQPPFVKSAVPMSALVSVRPLRRNSTLDTPRLNEATAESPRTPARTVPVPGASILIVGKGSVGLLTPLIPRCGRSHRATQREPSGE